MWDFSRLGSGSAVDFLTTHPNRVLLHSFGHQLISYHLYHMQPAVSIRTKTAIKCEEQTVGLQMNWKLNCIHLCNYSEYPLKFASFRSVVFSNVYNLQFSIIQTTCLNQHTLTSDHLRESYLYCFWHCFFFFFFLIHFTLMKHISFSFFFFPFHFMTHFRSTCSYNPRSVGYTKSL